MTTTSDRELISWELDSEGDSPIPTMWPTISTLPSESDAVAASSVTAWELDAYRGPTLTHIRARYDAGATGFCGADVLRPGSMLAVVLLVFGICWLVCGAVAADAWQVSPQLPLFVEGAVSVLVLADTVRRSFGTLTGLVAGALFTLTSLATLSTLPHYPQTAEATTAMVVALWAASRYLEDRRQRWWWIGATATAVGLLSNPVLTMVLAAGLSCGYLGSSPYGAGRRICRILSCGAVLVAAAVLCALAQQTFPRRGLSGLTAADWLALIRNHTQAPLALALPTALILLVVGYWVSRSTGQRERSSRLQYVMWGVWLVGGAAVTVLVSRLHHGDTLVLAPAVSALLAIGMVRLWALRDRARTPLTAAAVVTVAWCSLLFTVAGDGRAGRYVVALGLAPLVLIALAASRRRMNEAHDGPPELGRL